MKLIFLRGGSLMVVAVWFDRTLSMFMNDVRQLGVQEGNVMILVNIGLAGLLKVRQLASGL